MVPTSHALTHRFDAAHHEEVMQWLMDPTVRTVVALQAGHADLLIT